MPRDTTPSSETDCPTSERETCSPADGERSAERPPRAGLKGAGRSRSPQSPERPLSEASEASRGYVAQRPRATGGFPPSPFDTDDSGDDSHHDSSRAQTSIDFAVGASVFLLTVGFVIAFLPGTFAPFTASDTGDVLTADRTADLLAEQLLAPPTDPGVVDPDCAAEFFDAAGDGPDGLACEYATDADDLHGALGLDASVGVNVTVEENGTVQSVEHDGVNVELRAGPELPEDGSVVVSRRVVLLGGEERDLRVRVW